jgi:hypothetical protein
LQRARRHAAGYDDPVAILGRHGRAVKPIALCLALASLAATACIVPVHDGFATPHDAVLTFQSRLARDDVAGERDCFSQRFVEQSGASLQVYATVRDRFLDPLGFFGGFLLRHDSLVDNLEGGERSDLHARLVYSLVGHAFEVALTREASFKFPDPAGGAPHVAPLLRDWVHLVTAAAGGGTSLYVDVQVPAATAQSFLAGGGLPWAELVNGWKLEGVAPLEGTGAVKELPAAPAGETRCVAVDALRVKEVSESFGAVRLRVELPLGEASDCVRMLPDGTVVVGSPPAADGPAASVASLRFTARAIATQ